MYIYTGNAYKNKINTVKFQITKTLVFVYFYYKNKLLRDLPIYIKHQNGAA